VKSVLDTNVLVSEIFFGGLPRQLLDLWADGRFELIVSPSIIDEYLRTCDRLGASHPALAYEAILAALIGHATLAADVVHDEAVTADPDDDKFMLCARDNSALVVSGDGLLLATSGWAGVRVLTPRAFLNVLEEQA
jgi:putative PIN family toxin of toxin-antitoxin system